MAETSSIALATIGNYRISFKALSLADKINFEQPTIFVIQWPYMTCEQ